MLKAYSVISSSQMALPLRFSHRLLLAHSNACIAAPIHGTALLRHLSSVAPAIPSTFTAAATSSSSRSPPASLPPAILSLGLGGEPPSPALTFAQASRRVGNLLPHQGILENFVHHNPLESLQSINFRDAISGVLELEAYMSPGERVLSLTDVDPRKRANEALVGISAAFLDRGAAKWAPRFRDRGFLHFFAALEGLGFARWRGHARTVASSVLKAGITPDATGDALSASVSESILRDNALYFGIPAADTERALFSMLFELPGWAGMFSRMEHHPDEAPALTRVRLLDFCAVQSTLARSSIDETARHALGFGGGSSSSSGSRSVAEWLSSVGTRSDARLQYDAVGGASAIAFLDQTAEGREALESELEYALLDSIEHNKAAATLPKTPVLPSATASSDPAAGLAAAARGVELEAPAPQALASPATVAPQQQPQQTLLPACEIQPQTAQQASLSLRPSLQLYTCIDDRECSLRRHVEEEDPGAETFGIAGFFGVPVRHVPADGGGLCETVLAPEGQHPAAALVEVDDAAHPGEVARFRARRSLYAHFSQFWEGASFSPSGSLFLSTMFPFSLVRLLMIGYAPAAKQRVRDAIQHALTPRPHTDFATPYTPEQAAGTLANTFRGIGTAGRFARLVVVLGHGAASVNNPFAAAYNCGACGGREGGPNARLFARIANDPAVRARLASTHGVTIPSDTVFIGGKHNTTADEIEYFDVERLPASHADAFAAASATLERARGANALERCYRFLLANNVHTAAEALAHVKVRSVDTAEVRPELNHATNAAVIVGRRVLTKGCFFDRRAFLPSYDPSCDDERGSLLEGVLAPALVVCSGINLEYLFSTAMASRHGAGTKAPLNIVGNIAVLQGTSGDLRPGLPSQMTEMHTPVRALYIIDAPVSRVEAVLSRRPDLAQLVRNEWVRFIVRDPATGVMFRHAADGRYVEADEYKLACVVPSRDRFARQRTHGLDLARREDAIYYGAVAGMAAATALPLYFYGAISMNPYGPLIALAAATLAFPVLAFSRRYLHGEFMFGRFSALSVLLLGGFNLVATAPDLMHALSGWSLFGFSSAFLIGSYNDRPTVRNNATFAFGVYRVSDFALLTAAAFTVPTVTAAVAAQHEGLVAACLLLAAAYKSSQFPLAALFVRSMEGPTPTSALGYAGLSAHVGIVLLAGTMPMWYHIDAARIALCSIGLLTATHNSLVSRIRPDRKGSIARATSATLGLLFVLLSFGFREATLILALGHAALRMVQILRAPGAIADSVALRSALGYAPWPRTVPDWLYRTAWSLYRVDTDFHLISLLQQLSGQLHIAKPGNFSRAQQWTLTAIGIVIAGAPFTPFSYGLEEVLVELLHDAPLLAGALMVAHFTLSVFVIRYLFVGVLSSRRFSGPGGKGSIVPVAAKYVK